MREESHLDDMRAAIRGDFERLAERRGGQELMREPEPHPVQELEPEPTPAPSEPEPEQGAEPVAEPLVAAEAEPAEAVSRADEVPADEPPRRSFLDRLLGR